ncbi:heme-binding protein [[Mycobacterium] kokjensenii]|uniref:Heme-binding protein n=1 Tax=[Mycobacterium] kokjensenii TaxID=3064287 RepID=A0ABN9MXA1_9MYCO|nr:heme-binding protein [Mycolicibacter sp. MU0083]CAJ1496769.1 heme-binding protein [Mycolicibacter sp. MU0083]
MLSFTRIDLRGIYGGIAAGALAGAALFGAVGTAAADPTPANCTAADLARASASAATETAAYLTAHPDVNEFFTKLKTEPQDDAEAALQAYMDANPQVHTDLKQLRQPLADQQKRCNWTSSELPE